MLKSVRLRCHSWLWAGQEVANIHFVNLKYSYGEDISVCVKIWCNQLLLECKLLQIWIKVGKKKVHSESNKNIQGYWPIILGEGWRQLLTIVNSNRCSKITLDYTCRHISLQFLSEIFLRVESAGWNWNWGWARAQRRPFKARTCKSSLSLGW